LHRAITILLVICLHLQPLNNVCVVINYIINQDYIKEYLCINRDREDLQCNGKCYLANQLKQTESKNETDGQFPYLKITKMEYVKFSFLSDNYLHKMIPLFENKHSHYFLSTYFQINGEIFHPPRV
jgi:hypothetical protein